MSRPSIWLIVLMGGWNENPQFKREYGHPLDAPVLGVIQIGGPKSPDSRRKDRFSIFSFSFGLVHRRYYWHTGCQLVQKVRRLDPKQRSASSPLRPPRLKFIPPPTSGLEVGIQPTSNQKLHQQAMAPPFHINPSPPRDRVRQSFESLRSPPFKGPQAQAGVGLPPGFGQPVVSGNIQCPGQR